MLRPFQRQDMEQVIRIWLAASIQAHDFIPKEFWESKVADMRELYIPGSETYVYEEHGEVLGFISLREAVIAALFVAPRSQRRGIGACLMARAKELFSSLTLSVYKKNLTGIRFYRNHGFVVAKEQLDEHTGRPELLMHFP